MRCLVVDDLHPSLIQILEKEGIVVDYQPNINKNELEAQAGSFEILVIRSKFFVDRVFLEHQPTLKLIGRAGAGMDNIDLDAANDLNIKVVHAAEGNADAVGEHTIGLILMALNKMIEANRSVKAGNWDREAFRGMELKGKTVGLFGYGNMGRAVAKRLQSFDCNVIAYDKYLADWPDENSIRVDLETLKSESEILSIHLPLTKETEGMVNEYFLGQFKSGLILINTARGPIVPVEGLLQLLKQNHIQFAALDVLEREPPIEKSKKISSIYSELFSMPNVILTPHVAGWSLESYEKISTVLAHKLIYQIGLLKN